MKWDSARTDDLLFVAINNSFFGFEDGGTTAGAAMQIELENDAAPAQVANVYVWNTSSTDWRKQGLRIFADRNSGPTTVNVDSRNNAMIGSSNADYEETIQGAGTINFTNLTSVSADTTADDFGGSGNVTGVVASVAWDSPNTNMIPATAGDLYDAGTTISFFALDAILTSRPQGPSWDIGTIERILSAAGRRRIIVNRY